MRYIDTMRPHTGRYIAEDEVLFNIADDARRSLINVARGMAPDHQSFWSYGERTSTGAETNFPVWPDGPIKLPPATGVQMSVSSTSANDGVAGANVRSVELHYLDADLNPAMELVVLTGVTPVLTIATDIRWVQCMHVHTIGTIPSAAGIISATYGADTYSEIAVGNVRCSNSFRMVPAGKRLFIDGVVGGSVSATADTTTRLRLVASEIGNQQYVDPLILFPQASIGVQNSPFDFTVPPSLSFSAGSIVGFVHTSNKAATISASWFGRLEPSE